MFSNTVPELKGSVIQQVCFSTKIVNCSSLWWNNPWLAVGRGGHCNRVTKQLEYSLERG